MTGSSLQRFKIRVERLGLRVPRIRLVPPVYLDFPLLPCLVLLLCSFSFPPTFCNHFGSSRLETILVREVCIERKTASPFRRCRVSPPDPLREPGKEEAWRSPRFRTRGSAAVDREADGPLSYSIVVAVSLIDRRSEAI